MSSFNFGNLHPITTAYINETIKPLADTLDLVFDHEQFDSWIHNNMFVYTNYIVENTQNMEFEEAKNFILQMLAKILLLGINVESDFGVTPWDISRNNDEEKVKMFGPPSETIGVKVHTGPNIYEIQMNEESAYGVILGLSLCDKGVLDENGENCGQFYTLVINGERLTTELFERRYAEPIGNQYLYVVLVDGRNIPFYMEQGGLLLGLLTANKFTSTKFQDIVNSIYKVDGETTLELEFAHEP